ncbi:hypothetical protein [uncultured Brevibacillus sp.]|uniref:hypothetical protein n=1 Tax=uncultured Brevibacillus sp. TaxID=169970 RepID=UPI00259A1AF6|nr:hypothetical protein [uncultured Brevibacillus sp.]
MIKRLTYWKKNPPHEYLQALGAQPEDLKTHHGKVKLGEQLGLTPLYSVVASEDDWDAYEGLYASSIENYCYENPNDADAEAMFTRIRSWRNTKPYQLGMKVEYLIKRRLPVDDEVASSQRMENDSSMRKSTTFGSYFSSECV